MNHDADPSHGPSDPQDQNAQSPSKPQLNTQKGQPNWLDDLARRSSGLPSDQPPQPSLPQKGDSSLWKLAGLGVQFAATTAIFAFMGNALDKKMGWSPWGLVSLSLLAVIGNLYLLIKESLKQDNPTRPPPKA